MAKLLKINLAIFLLIFTTSAEKLLNEKVEDLMKWYTRRSKEASEYEFPTDARMYETKDKFPQEYGTFDFIVVGAGSAGCVVASRLSEISDWKVLLLEAGTYKDENFTSVPAWTGLNINSKYNWGYRTTPQKESFLGFQDGIAMVARGKGVGGSSLINGLACSRSDKQDYNKWAELVSDSTWSYSNVLPYFKKSETFTRTNPYVPLDEEYHGFEGPLRMTHVVPFQNFSKSVLEGGKQLGYNIIDYNGKETVGFSVWQYYMKDGLRFDSEMAFLSPAKKRKNLVVLDRSYVTKIQLTPTNKKVEGVIFTRDNKTFIARSQKEVILSAGAISSPKILLLSGIGPRDHLESIGISVKQDLPVGKTLRDHATTQLVFSSNYSNEDVSLEQSIRDLLNSQGALTKVDLAEAIGIFKTPVEPKENSPDVDFMLANVTAIANEFSDEIAKVFTKNASSSFIIQLILLHQKSTGTLQLKNADPFEYPLIDPNFLSDKENHDIETLYQAVQIILKLMETDSMRRLNVSLAFDDLPGCSHNKPLSREYWYCYFRTITGLGLDVTATCLTGTNPETAVVDSKLRVFGVEGLRVADASVIPLSLSGHTNAPCNMIGEKVADIIKGYYRYPIYDYKE